MDKFDNLERIYIGSRDSTQSPANCDGCYFHNRDGRLCGAGAGAMCSLPNLMSMGTDYYIYKEKGV